MHLFTRALLAAAALILSTATLPALADYPERPITLVLPFSPGGETDPLARMIGERLGEALDQPVVIKNQPGASGAIAFGAVAQAPADGYTLLWGFSSPLVVNPILYKDLPYDVEQDFAPISLVAEGQFVLVVNPDVPAKSVQELIDYAKANPDKLNYASAGVGSPLHLAAELFMARTGTKMVHVAYKSGSDAALAILSGEADVLFGSISASKGNIDAGKVRALAVTGNQRATPLPDLPTVKEAGLPDFVMTAWHSIVAPAGTPQPVIDRLRAELVKILSEEDVKERLDTAAVIPVSSTGPELAERIREETAMWRTIVEQAGITVE